VRFFCPKYHWPTESVFAKGYPGKKKAGKIGKKARGAKKWKKKAGYKRVKRF
jgi:hypothetical protein